MLVGDGIRPVRIDVRQTATVVNVSMVHQAGRTSWWRTDELHFNRAICDISSDCVVSACTLCHVSWCISYDTV